MKLPKSEIFGPNLARIRRMHRWSQRDLAKMIDVHQTMVARWESGKTVPRLEIIEKLALTLEVGLKELLASQDAQSLPPLSTDTELRQLLGMVDSFEARDREALKAFLEAIIVKNRVKAAVQQAS